MAKNGCETCRDYRRTTSFLDELGRTTAHLPQLPFPFVVNERFYEDMESSTLQCVSLEREPGPVTDREYKKGDCGYYRPNLTTRILNKICRNE